jgi:pilus assembly protein CpaB
MKKGTSLAILIAGVVVALLAGSITFGWLQKRTTVQTRAASTQQVVVAAVDLAWGRVLDAAQVKTVTFLQASLPQGCFSQPSEVQGRTLLYPVRAGEPIFESQLAPRTAETGGIAAVIRPRERAMAVKVDKVIGVSGFIHPGNRVDVVATFDRLGNDPTPTTKTVLENVLVLAAGVELEKTGKGEKPAPVDVITLEVSADEGEKLALAATEGKLQLALRNQADAAEVPTSGITVTRLMSSVSPKEPAPVRHVAAGAKKVAKPAVKVAAVDPVKPIFVVEVIRGTAMSTLKYEKGE